PAAPQVTPAPTPAPRPQIAAVGQKELQYQQLVQKVLETVRRQLPGGSSVLVVSKGDNDLLQLDPCRAAHFPQGPDGKYAGYYPADSAAAIAHLKELQKRGAHYLVLPQTALWW